MTTRPGITRPAIAIIGSGPSAFYAADHYLKQSNLDITVDMFERLPTPYGLVRGGVAPDHQKIKSVTRVFDKIASHPGFRYFGNVAFCKDVSLEVLQQYYHQIIVATGASDDRKLGIPGEHLPGSHSATAFVAWYNGHPDFHQRVFDFSCERAVVIGAGNVAIDVARILARTPDELRKTDIADYALEQLSQSKIREIFLVARRGPAQAAFTNPELKELGELPDADVFITPENAAPDPLTIKFLETHRDPMIEKNLQTLREFASRGLSGKKRRIVFRFLESPREILGQGRAQRIVLEKNRLTESPDGSLRPKSTGQVETIDAGLILRSIGYRGRPLQGLPFDEKAHVIPNERGRILDDFGHPIPGLYCAGWIKRGPTGVIGTNKPDAMETVSSAMSDLASGTHIKPEKSNHEIDALLKLRGIRTITYSDWKKLDDLERKRGASLGRPRIKFTSVEDMLDALNTSP